MSISVSITSVEGNRTDSKSFLEASKCKTNIYGDIYIRYGVNGILTKYLLRVFIFYYKTFLILVKILLLCFQQFFFQSIA